MTEPWLEAERLAARGDRWLSRRPVCADCGARIADDRCFPLDGGEYLCERCMWERMVEVEECMG